MRIRHGFLCAFGLVLLACAGSSVPADGDSEASAEDASTSDWPTSSLTSSAVDGSTTSTSSTPGPTTSSSSSSSTSGADVCEYDGAVDVFADAFEKVDPTPYTTSIQETCELEAASADSADFICPGGGAIGVVGCLCRPIVITRVAGRPREQQPLSGRRRSRRCSGTTELGGDVLRGGEGPSDPHGSAAAGADRDVDAGQERHPGLPGGAAAGS